MSNLHNKTLASALGGLLLAASGAASAVVIPAGDSIRFSFAGFDEATSGYTGDCGTIGPGAAADTPDAAACDAVAGIPARFAESVTSIAGTGDEDTWGVAEITQITGTASGNIYAFGQGGEFITAMFYGLHDGIVDAGLVSTATFSYAGFLDIYSDTVDDLPVTPGPGSRGADNDGNVGPTFFAGATEGTLLLRLAFAPGGNADVPDATLNGSFNNSSIGGGSSSLFDVDVLGGTLADLFNSNTVLGADGNFHDFDLDVGFRCANVNVACNPNNTNPALFSLEIDGSFRGVTVPEPAPLTLMGIGLLGLLAAFRRQSRS